MCVLQSRNDPAYRETHDIPRASCTFDIHLVTEALPLYVVPFLSSTIMGHGSTCIAEAYKFDGDLVVVQQVVPFKYDSETSFTDLLANAIMYAHHV